MISTHISHTCNGGGYNTKRWRYNYIFWCLSLLYLYDSKLPPCLIPYPIIENMHLMKPGKATEAYRRLRTKYGDIFTLHLGRQSIIIFNEYENIRNAFIKQAEVFSDRPRNFFPGKFRGKGIIRLTRLLFCFFFILLSLLFAIQLSKYICYIYNILMNVARISTCY